MAAGRARLPVRSSQRLSTAAERLDLAGARPEPEATVWRCGRWRGERRWSSLQSALAGAQWTQFKESLIRNKAVHELKPMKKRMLHYTWSDQSQ